MEQVHIEHRQPGAVLGKIVIELTSNTLDFWELRARDIREVVVLHVVAYIEGQIVPGAVIRVRLISSVKHVVLGNEVGRHWMDAQREHSANQKIVQRFEPPEVPNESINGYLHDQVQCLQFRRRFRADKERSEGIEERL